MDLTGCTIWDLGRIDSLRRKVSGCCPEGPVGGEAKLVDVALAGGPQLLYLGVFPVRGLLCEVDSRRAANSKTVTVDEHGSPPWIIRPNNVPARDIAYNDIVSVEYLQCL